jgi:hypothetical protein
MKQWSLMTAALCATAVLLLWGRAQSNGKVHKGIAAATSPTPTENTVVWETSLDAAQARAQREGKPILLLHLFGRLDEELP